MLLNEGIRQLGIQDYITACEVLDMRNTEKFILGLLSRQNIKSKAQIILKILKNGPVR